MSVYEKARRHALLMLANTGLGFIFIVLVDRYFGHSAIAFGIVVGVLIAFNFGLWKYNCPRCGDNLFMRSNFPMPWPNKTCSKCDLELSESDETQP